MRPEPAEIDKRFTRHTADENQVFQMDHVREQARVMAHQINVMTPDSREKSLALTKLEEAVFWHSAAISRHSEEFAELCKGPEGAIAHNGTEQV